MLPLLPRQSPSPAPESLSLPSSLLWQGQCGEGDSRGAAHDGSTRCIWLRGRRSGAQRPAAAGPARSGPRPPVRREAARDRRSSARRPAAAGLACGGPRLLATVLRAPSVGRCRSGAHRPGPPVRRATGPGRCLTCIHLESISVMAVDGTENWQAV
jgi:hypothetical protein